MRGDGEECLLLGGDGEPLAADLREVVGTVDEDAETVEVVHPHGVVVRVGVQEDAQAQLGVGAVRPPQNPARSTDVSKNSKDRLHDPAL